MLLQYVRDDVKSRSISPKAKQKKKKVKKPFLKSTNKALEMISKSIPSAISSAVPYSYSGPSDREVGLTDEDHVSFRDGTKYFANIRLKNGKYIEGGSNDKANIVKKVWKWVKKNYKQGTTKQDVEGWISSEGNVTY